jgi:hypothetical protein
MLIINNVLYSLPDEDINIQKRLTEELGVDIDRAAASDKVFIGRPRLITTISVALIPKRLASIYNITVLYICAQCSRTLIPRSSYLFLCSSQMVHSPNDSFAKWYTPLEDELKQRFQQYWV